MEREREGGIDGEGEREREGKGLMNGKQERMNEMRRGK